MTCAPMGESASATPVGELGAVCVCVRGRTEEKGSPVAVKVASSTPEMRAPVSQGKRANAQLSQPTTARAGWARVEATRT